MKKVKKKKKNEWKMEEKIGKAKRMNERMDKVVKKKEYSEMEEKGRRREGQGERKNKRVKKMN